MTTPAYMMPLVHMTFDEAFALLADAQKQKRTVTLFCECTGESWHMRPGQKYTLRVECLQNPEDQKAVGRAG